MKLATDFISKVQAQRSKSGLMQAVAGLPTEPRQGAETGLSGCLHKSYKSRLAHLIPFIVVTAIMPLYLLSVWPSDPETGSTVWQMSLAPILPLLALIQRFIKRPSADQEPEIDSNKLLQRYGQKLIATPLDIDLILEVLLQQMQALFAPASAFIFLRDNSKDGFTIRAAHGEQSQTVEVQFGLNDDLAGWLTKKNEPLQLDPVPLAARRKVAQEEIARLRMLHATWCVPLAGSTHLIGWIALGDSTSDEAYKNSDLVLLATLANQTAITLENAQLLEQAHQRAAEFEALHKISTEIQTEAQPGKLLTLVVEQACKLLGAAGGMVLLREPNDKAFKVVVSHALDQDYRDWTVQIDEGIVGQVISTNGPVVTDSYHSFLGRSPQFAEAAFGAVLGVPLRWEGVVQGVLQLVHAPQGLRFREHDIWLLEFFATQSALSLEKSHLIQNAQRRASHLATLSEVSMAINSTLDLDTALNRIMEQAVQILYAEAGSLLLVAPSGKELTFEVVLGPTGSELKGKTTPIGKGIVGTVAQTGRPQIISDVAEDPRFNVAFDEATDFRTKNIICVPMVAFEQQVIGVIELINKQDGSVFNQEDSSLLLSFAAQAAIAIENARIFTRTDQALAERVQELQLLQIFDQQLQTSLLLEKVLDISLDQMMDALGLSMGLIGLFNGDDPPDLNLLAQRGMPTEMGRYKVDPWPVTKGILGQVAQTGEAVWINDMTQAKNYVPKTHRTLSLLVVPIMREDRVIGVVDLESSEPGFFTGDDMTFIRQMTSHAAIAIENAQLFEQVNEANDAKSEFMSIAAHELKIPMTSIKGYAKLIQMGAGGELTEKQSDFLSVITNNVDRMARLVQDLLDVSRIEAGRIRLEIQDVQMAGVIEEVIDSVKTQMETKSLDLALDVDPALPELRADHGRMVQIITNLVSNAYKYTPEGGKIWVIAQPHSNGEFDGIRVTVKDTGYGISEEDQAQLFTNFFRASDENIRNEPGTGLGLSITKKMIESHGGELSFESELNVGTAFTFTVPRVSKIPPGVEVTER